MRTMLLLLMGFTAATAILSGIVLLLQPTGALGLSTELLKGTPFHSFLIPALILTVVVGGVNAAALFINLRQTPVSFGWSLAASITIAGWIVVQLLMIKEFFWIQWLYLLIGCCILLMTLQLKHKELI